MIVYTNWWVGYKYVSAKESQKFYVGTPIVFSIRAVSITAVSDFLLIISVLQMVFYAEKN